MIRVDSKHNSKHLLGLAGVVGCADALRSLRAWDANNASLGAGDKAAMQ